MRIRRLLTSIIIGTLLNTVITQPVLALSLNDYFMYSYSFTFSKTNIVGSETFTATVTGQATCVQDLPLPVDSATIVSRVIARHTQTGTEVIINPNYSISYSSEFPYKQGQTASAIAQVPLSFPAGGPSGTYDIIGQLVEAKITVLAINIDVTAYLPSTQAMSTVTYTPPQTPGGGGGGSTPPDLSISVTDLSSLINSYGELIVDIEAISRDGKAVLKLSRGTKFTVSGDTGTTITIRELDADEVPDPDEEQVIIGKAYDFSPDGAIFSPPAHVFISFDPSLLPEGAEKSSLSIARWNPVNSEWVFIEDCSVNEIDNIVSGTVSHFTIYTLISKPSPPPLTSITTPTSTTPEPETPSPTLPITTVPPPTLSPASFLLSGLTIEPGTVKSGKTITITALLTNTGDSPGTCTVIMKIDGQIMNSQDIQLGGRTSQIATFTHLANIEGTHTVTIDNLRGEFLVKSSRFTLETLKWWVIGGLAGLVMGAIGAGSIIIISRRRKSQP
jgi:hypothetical protein